MTPKEKVQAILEKSKEIWKVRRAIYVETLKRLDHIDYLLARCSKGDRNVQMARGNLHDLRSLYVMLIDDTQPEEKE